MMRAAVIGAVLASISGVASAQAPPEEPQPLVCVGPAKTRQLFFEKGLIPPIQVLKQAAGNRESDAVGIQLCWFHGSLVYDVTLLEHDGIVTHRLISAADGKPLGDHPKP